MFISLTELQNRMLHISFLLLVNTAISRKIVEKSARDNSERYCGWFWVHCFSKKFECLRVLKESNKSKFDSCSVGNSVLNISHITFRECRAQNSCIQQGGGGELLPIHSLKWIQTMFSKVAKRSSRVLPADLCTDHAHYAKNKRSTVFEKEQKHGSRRRDCFSVLYLLILSMSLFSVWFL